MKTYEYKHVRLGLVVNSVWSEGKLNQYGSQGWRAVRFEEDNQSGILSVYMERENSHPYKPNALKRILKTIAAAIHIKCSSAQLQ